MNVLAGVLLGLSVAMLAVSGVALLAIRDVPDRIHYAGLPATAAPLLVAGALAAGGAAASVILKAVLLLVLVACGSAFVSHAVLAAIDGGPGRAR